jgi:hypothetical protein
LSSPLAISTWARGGRFFLAMLSGATFSSALPEREREIEGLARQESGVLSRDSFSSTPATTTPSGRTWSAVNKARWPIGR